MTRTAGGEQARTQRAPILIAAGGTGGHLFPARALAEELARRAVEVDLVTDPRGQAIDPGFPARGFHLVPAATPVGRSPWAAVRAAATLLRGVVVARGLIRRLGPGAVVGFGGYPTVPPLIAAWLAGIPAMVHEQNAVMGRANRLLARLVDAVAQSVAHPAKAGARLAAKSVLTGNPVRDAVKMAREVRYQAPSEGGRLRLLVFGGSQGAHVFAELMPAALSALPDRIRARIDLVLQCRPEDLAAARAALAGLAPNAELAPFFADLPARIAGAHLVIARSGASTVAELTAIGRPAILVPLPHAIDNDQLENARALAAVGGARLVEQREASPARLAAEIADLAGAPATLVRMADAARGAGRPDAATALADLVEHLAHRHGLAGFGPRAG